MIALFLGASYYVYFIHQSLPWAISPKFSLSNILCVMVFCSFAKILSANLCCEPFCQNFLPPKFCIVQYTCRSQEGPTSGDATWLEYQRLGWVIESIHVLPALSYRMLVRLLEGCLLTDVCIPLLFRWSYRVTPGAACPLPPSPEGGFVLRGDLRCPGPPKIGTQGWVLRLCPCVSVVLCW